MAPVNQLGVLAFASAVLAVPHAQWQPFKRHAHASPPPAYGGSSSAAAYSWGGSSSAGPASESAPSAYPSGSSSSWGPSGSAPPYPSNSGSSSWGAVSSSSYPSGAAYPTGSYSSSPVSSSAPIPSASAYPECWTCCFDKAGIKSESELCGNTEVDACIQKECSAAEDKAYWTWYDSFCPAASSSGHSVKPASASGYGSVAPYPTPSGSGWAHPTGYQTGGWGTSIAAPSHGVCTLTSTLIYRSTTVYSTYTASPVPASSAGAASGSAPAYGAPSGAAPAGYSAAAQSASAYGAPSGAAPAGYSAAAQSASAYGAPSGAAPAGESCAAPVTVTATVQTTVYVTPEGPYGHGAPTASSAAPAKSAAPSYGAGSWSASASNYAAASAPNHAAASSYPAAASSGAASWSASASSGSAPAPSSSAPATGGQKGKRGLAYNDASLANALGTTAAGGWAYNWLSSSSGLDSSIPYIPMLWGPTSDFTGTWEADAKSGIAAGAQYLFSFNEADMTTQSDLTPAAAAAAWKQYMEPFAGQVKLVAPSVTNSQSANMGLNWLQQFLEACSDCTIDAVAQHWYFPTNDVDNFKQQVTNAVSTAGGKGVFVNEFGATGTDEEKSQFLSQVMPWLDSNPDVLGYSYFMVSDGLLMTGSGPSSLGNTYCS